MFCKADRPGRPCRSPARFCGFDHVIGRNRDVRGTALDHAQHGGEHASDRGYLGYLAPIRIPRGGQRVVVPEQLVCTVDQMDVRAQLQQKPTGLASSYWISTNVVTEA